MTLETTSLDSATRAFTALADPLRLRVVTLLQDGRRCVCELREEIEASPSLISYHLKVLREAGLVKATRRGRWIDYELSHDLLAELRDLLPEGSK